MLQFCMAHMIRKFQPDDMASHPFFIEETTGPVSLMESMNVYARYAGKNVTVLRPGLVYGYDWNEVRNTVGREN